MGEWRVHKRERKERGKRKERREEKIEQLILHWGLHLLKSRDYITKIKP